MSLFKKLLGPLLRKWPHWIEPPPRELQFEADIFKLYLLSIYRNAYYAKSEEFRGKSINVEEQRDVREKLQDQLTQEVQEKLNKHKSTRERQEAIHKNVHTQVLSLLETSYRIFNGLPLEKDPKRSFELTQKTSNMERAGSGIFLKGTALPGSVVAFYPGIVYMPIDYPLLPNYPNFGFRNEYLMTRFDDLIIDAMGYDPSKPFSQSNDFVNHLSGNRDQSLVPSNHFSLGHLLNHPNPDKQDNLMPFGYDFPSNFPQHLRPLIPNRYIRKPSLLTFKDESACVMRGIVLIATRHVKDGEELFLNYRYNPNSSTSFPSWYQSVNPEADRRLWHYQH